MTLLSLDKVIVYRAASLRHYATTHSTVGSRMRGGRFNRPGFAALYLALDADTALAEYWQADPPRPLVLVPNELNVIDALDIRKGTPAVFDACWTDWRCDWKRARERFDDGDPTADCASWRCGDDAVNRRLPGIVYPSTARSGGANIVIFPDHVIAGKMVLTVLDPDGEIAAANPARLI